MAAGMESSVGANRQESGRARWRGETVREVLIEYVRSVTLKFSDAVAIGREFYGDLIDAHFESRVLVPLAPVEVHSTLLSAESYSLEVAGKEINHLRLTNRDVSVRTEIAAVAYRNIFWA